MVVDVMKRSLLFASLLLTLLLLGCRGKGNPSRNNLQTIIQYYNMYTSEHEDKPPADEAAFKAFLAEKKVADIDQLLTSPRDNKPYKINYGAKAKEGLKKPTGLVPPDMVGTAKAIIAEEQSGAGGKRLVAYTTGVIEEVP
jgi:hypothetical protein